MHAFEPKKLAIASGLTASLLGAFILGGVALGQVSANSHGTPAATATPGQTGIPQTQEPAEKSDDNEKSDTPIDPAQAKIAQTAAEATALGAYPGGSVVKSYLDNEHGTLVWDITVKDAQGATHDVLVDATTGQIVTAKAESAGDDNEAPIDPASAKVTQAQAESTALGAYPGGSVIKAQLDSEHGTLVWDVEVKDSKGATHDVKVDATTGQVITELRDAPGTPGSDD